MPFWGKRVLIVGLGISNLAVIQYLAEKDLASLIVTDLKSSEELKDYHTTAKNLCPRATFVLGKHNKEDFLEADIIIKSPSIPFRAPLIQKAIEYEIPIESDITLFLKLIPTKNVIGITGTKGKTTTATLLAKVLEDQGHHVVLAGNMGIPVMRELSKITKDTWVVLELSSYMVESMSYQEISTPIAVYTNIFPDHLNHYKTFEAYQASKQGLYKHQSPEDITVLNTENPTLTSWKGEITSRLLSYTSEDMCSSCTPLLLGSHNKSNIASVCALVKELGLDIAQTVATINDFDGVEHRMESLGVINNIEFINNSAATNPGAFLADARALLAKKKPLYVLAGGADKSLDFKDMADFINNQELLKKVALFAGTGTNRLGPLLAPKKVVGIYASMQDTFNNLLSQAKRDSIVILNPGCASYGVFKNEFDRGTQFKESVLQLK